MSKEEDDIRHKISDIDEKIQQKGLEIRDLELQKVDLKNDLFIWRQNRRIRQ